MACKGSTRSKEVNEHKSKHSHTSRSGAATPLKQGGVGRTGWSEKALSWISFGLAWHWAGLALALK